MVGNTYPYTEANWNNDITLALNHGIDGFALNVGSGGNGDWQRAQVQRAFDAALKIGKGQANFGLMFSLDMT